MRKVLARLTLIISVGALVLVAQGAAALAGTGPVNPASVNGTIQINSTLAFSTSFTSFTVGSTSVPLNTWSGTGQIYWQDNDSNGITINEQGPSAFVNGAYSINDNTIAYSQVNNVPTGCTGTGAPQMTQNTLSSGMQYVLITAGVSGNLNCSTFAPATLPLQDSMDLQGWKQLSAPTVPAGSYAGVVTLSLWSN